MRIGYIQKNKVKTPINLNFKVSSFDNSSMEAGIPWKMALKIHTKITKELRRQKEIEAYNKAPLCYSDTGCKGKMVGGSWGRMGKCDHCGHQEIPY